MGHIVPGGAAELDGRLMGGDLIMSVDGVSVMNSTHHHVVQLMIAAAKNGRVTLGIRRRIAAQENHHMLHQHYVQSGYGCQPIGHVQYPYEV